MSSEVKESSSDGSSTNTSRAAPATCPSFKASASRRFIDQFTAGAVHQTDAFLHLLDRLWLIMPVVCGVKPTCSVCSRRQRRVHLVAIRILAPLRSRRETKGSWPTSSMPKARARPATSIPIRPRPTIPSVLPRNSVPCSDFFSHFPACMRACLRGQDGAPSPASCRGSVRRPPLRSLRAYSSPQCPYASRHRDRCCPRRRPHVQ